MTKPTGIVAPFSDRAARSRTPLEQPAGQVALVVLGMHRSGTSALTRVLSLSGYALPKTLMEPSADNVEGFWESRPIAEFNDFLLAQTGSSWDDPFAFSPGRSGLSALHTHMDRAVQLIRSEFPDARSLVLKDPRITVLYDFWLQALRAAGYEPAPIICVRNPLEVAASLSKRNGFPANKSLLIWLSYQLAAERATRDSPRAFVMYEDLINDWRACLDHIEQSLAMPLERRDLHAEVLIERSLRPDLRHHRSSEDQLAAIRSHPAWVGDAYAWFSAAARSSNPDPSALAPVVSEYSKQRRWFGPVIADLTLRLADLERSTTDQVAALEARILETNDILQDQIDIRDSQIRAIQIQHEDDLKRLSDERNQQVEDMRAAFDAEIQRRDDQIVTLEAMRAQASTQLETETQRLAALLASARQAQTDLDARFVAQIDSSQRELAEVRAAYETELAKRDQQITDLNDHYRAEAVRLEEERAALVAANAAAERRGMEAEGNAARLERQLVETNRVFETEFARREEDLRRFQVHTDAERTTLLAEMASVHAAYRAQIESRDADTERLRKHADAETARLRGELDAAKALIDQFEAAAGELNAQLDALSGELAGERHLNGHHVSQIDGLQARISDVARAYEDQLARREVEVRAEISHALGVIRDLESDILRLRMFASEKANALDRVTAEYDAVIHSTSWRASQPLRKLGRAAPWVARAGRVSARAAWSIATLRSLKSTPARDNETGQPPAWSAQPHVPPQGAAAPLANLTAATDTATHAAAPRLDPEPIARYLAAEQFEPEQVEIWREQCRRFPLPIDPRSSDKPKIDLTDAEAAQWLARCREAGANLRPFSTTPDVTIVIPVYNQLAFTLSAIASIYAQQTHLTYEIIVGDDGSSDQTRDLTDQSLPRVRIVRHGRNLGFIGNCNAAAASARGGVIVFLNNDVVVLPRWLDELVAPLRKDPSVGFVGSKLLYADGTLQEAGGIVWRDGSAWNYGRGQDPRDPRYCYAREVDYVSGASIAVRAADWRSLGGFDGKTYEIAYYEDVDLAFRIRAMGLKTLFQPLSALVHFEGASSGVDLTKGMKKHQVVNGERFFERWRDTLASHRPNAVEPQYECERKVGGRMLVIDAVTPTPDRDAGSLVMVEMLRCFQDLGWRISFIPEDNFAHMPRDTAGLQRMGIEALYWPYYQSIPEILEKRGAEFDIVLISRMRPAEKHLEAVRRHAPQARIIFNTVDLHYLREAREAALSGGAEAQARAERTKAIELAAVQSSDLTIVHSTVERDILERESSGSPVYVFPWVADPHPEDARINGRRDVVFVGGFRHAPNVDGLRWFLQEIWPRVRAHAPDATLKVIGSEAPREIEVHNGQAGVTIMGWVPDLDSELARARVSVAPLRYGAGVKGKVVSALRVGLPVVCTTIASEGMGLAPGRDVMVDDDPARFADAVVRLLSDDNAWTFLSRNGRKFVADNYSRDVACRRVAEMITRVGLEPDRT